MKAPPILLPLLLAALPLATTAQTAPAPPDTATTYKHQLGLTASPVLDGFFKNNRSLPVGLLYKRQLKPNQALRLGLVLNQRNDQRNKTNSPSVNPIFNENRFSLQLYIGQEWQRYLSSRWVAYAGMDIGAGYDRLRRRDESISIINPDTDPAFFLGKTDYHFTTYSAFIRPFIAVRYQVRSYLYVSAESALLVKYSHIAFRGNASSTRLGGSTMDFESVNTRRNNLVTSLQPVSQITLHYCFGSAER